MHGINYPTALEGAVKLKEISCIHAQGYPAGEMKHGPNALLDARVPAVSIAVPGTIFDKVLSNAQEAKTRDAELFDTLLPVPTVDELLSRHLTVIPLKRLSHHIAAHRGLEWISRGTWRRASPWCESRDKARHTSDQS